MKHLSLTLTSGLLALGLAAGSAFAQTTGQTTPAPLPGKAAVTTAAPAPIVDPTAKKAKAVGAKQATTPEGQACSAEADTKNLHGDARKKFRKGCIADMKKAAGTGKAAAAPAGAAAPTTAATAGKSAPTTAAPVAKPAPTGKLN